jgi:DMSO/TMAO reductase YedYZ heme-binding membrane subunit
MNFADIIVIIAGAVAVLILLVAILTIAENLRRRP